MRCLFDIALHQTGSNTSASTLPTRVSAGETIQTGENQKASFLFTDLSVLRLNQQTTVEIKDMNHLQVKQGLVYVDVNPSNRQQAFLVDTPATRITVLGTAFEIQASQTQTTVTVYEGEVIIADAEREEHIRKEETMIVSPTSHTWQKQSKSHPFPEWVRLLSRQESQNPFIQAMQKLFPSRSIDLYKFQGSQ
ncbi:hypothetical protein GF373_11870 [bacterium]|nr:hypothetical protein [bacterium]